MEKDIEMVQALHLRQKNIKSSLCDYSDAYILVRGNITAINDEENIDIALKFALHLSKCINHINGQHTDIVKGLTLQCL